MTWGGSRRASAMNKIGRMSEICAEKKKTIPDSQNYSKLRGSERGAKDAWVFFRVKKTVPGATPLESLCGKGRTWGG